MGKKLGTYETGLGIWCWVKMKGKNIHTCRIIRAHQLLYKVTDIMEGKKLFIPNTEYTSMKKETSNVHIYSKGGFS